MTTVEERRWQDIVDRKIVGEAVTEDELAFCRDHEASHEACGAENRRWTELVDILGKAHTSDLDDAQLVERIMQAAPKSPRARRPSRATAAVAGLSAMAAAVALTSWLTVDRDSREPMLRAAPATPPVTEVSQPLASIPTSVAAPIPFAIAHEVEGALQSGPTSLTAGSPIEPGTLLTSASGRSCLGYGAPEWSAVTLCLEADTTVSLSAIADGSAIANLERGRVTARLRPAPLPNGRSFSVRTDAGTVTAIGTIFTVEVDRAIMTVAVEEGLVDVRTSTQAVRLGAGERVSFPASGLSRDMVGRMDRRSTGDSPTAADLQARARAARTGHDYREAAALYRRLIKLYPNTPEAKLAFVVLGDLLRTNLRDPDGALQSYDRYLQEPGSLAEEARYGRIRALEALGHQSEERHAMEAFLHRHPDSLHAPELRRRLQVLLGR